MINTHGATSDFENEKYRTLSKNFFSRHANRRAHPNTDCINSSFLVSAAPKRNRTKFECPRHLVNKVKFPASQKSVDKLCSLKRTSTFSLRAKDECHKTSLTSNEIAYVEFFWNCAERLRTFFFLWELFLSTWTFDGSNSVSNLETFACICCKTFPHQRDA